jgi:Transglycosylase SLT domain
LARENLAGRVLAEVARMPGIDACGSNVRAWGPLQDYYPIVCDCPEHSGREWTLVQRAGRAMRLVVREIRQWAVPMALILPVSLVALYPTETVSIADRLVGSSEPSVGSPTPLSTVPPIRRSKKVRQSYTLESAREDFFRTEVPYGAVVYEEARRNGLPPELVAAVIETESNFHSRRRSGKNALGLMQIVPATGRQLSDGDLMSYRENIRAGAKYLRHLSRRYDGNMRLALAAYNAGEGNVARYQGVPPFPETRNYLRRVSTRKLLYQRHVARRYVRARRLSGSMALQ